MVRKLAKVYEKSPEQIFFAYIRSLGIVFLTGTTSPDHMFEDLIAADDLRLKESELNDITKMLI